jgi:hypothetical protein
LVSNDEVLILWCKEEMNRFYDCSNNSMISFAQVQKKDLPIIAKIYAKAYNKE